jgi:hypothetical protein
MSPISDVPPLAELAALGDPAALLARAGEPPEPTDRYTGDEDTRSVWVSVDPRCRLLSVDISVTWRLRLSPEALGDALFTAYSAAVRTAQAAEEVRRGARRTRPAAPAPGAAAADLDTWLAGVREWTAATDERLAGLAAAAGRYDSADGVVRDVTGPAGYVTLRLRAGGLTGITADPAGLRSANPNVLRQDVLAAFRAAGLAED